MQVLHAFTWDLLKFVINLFLIFGHPWHCTKNAQRDASEEMLPPYIQENELKIDSITFPLAVYGTQQADNQFILNCHPYILVLHAEVNYKGIS